MVKIGSNSGGLGSNRERPDAGTPMDPFRAIASPLNRTPEASGVSWFSAGRAVANELALAWFGQYESVSLGEYIDSFADEDPVAKVAKDFFPNPDWLSDRVIPSILAGASSLGEFVPFGASTLGPRIVEFLNDRGITGWNFYFTTGGELLDGSEEKIAVIWQGAWATEFGSRAVNRFEIYRDSAGAEWCYVYTNVAVATRKPLGLGNAMSRYVAVARQLLNHLFIAETPVPSSIMSIGRGIAYPEVPGHFLPHPFVSVDDYAIVTGVTGEHHWPVAPQVIKAGFAFSSEAEEFFNVIIPTVVDATTNLSTIAEDGFRNYRTPGCDIPYDYSYGSEYVYWDDQGVYPGVVTSEAISTAGYSRFIPEVFLGPLIEATDRALFNALDSTDETMKRSLLEWVVLEGAGQHVAAAINDLCFGYLMSENDWEAASILLNIAIDLDVPNQSTNALANLGQVQFAMGDSEGAKETLQKALDRPDKYSEGEACYHLGLIFSEEGDEVSARSYLERGAQAEGAFNEEFAAKCREKLGAVGLGTNSTTEAPTHKFCGQCGAGRVDGARFCGECGGKF